MDERQHADPLDGHLAHLQTVGIGNRAVHRGADFGPGQVEPRLVDGGLRLRDRGLLAGSDRGMGVGGARLGVGERSLGRTHFVERVFIVGAGGETALQKRGLTCERVALDLEIRSRTRNVGAGTRSLRAKLGSLQSRRSKLCPLPARARRETAPDRCGTGCRRA